MLRGLIICPDAEMAKRLEEALQEASQNVAVVKTLDRYPSGLELMRFVRAHAPQVIFLSTESLTKTAEVVGALEQESVGLALVAISRTCEPEVLLDLMRAGIREFLSMPFQRQVVYEALRRVEEMVQKKPPTIDSSDYLFSFLPSKQGVGTSTIALNAAVALSRGEAPGSVLHVDLDLTSGIVGFMLKLTNTRSVVEAAENWQSLDETLWPQLVTKHGKLHVLPSGRLQPELRIEGSQLRHILDFARRHYQAICLDLSGNLERYSQEVMHESKRIFMVCTPEIPSLHLAREKLQFLQQMDLGDRVSVLLNRSQKRSIISSEQVQSLLGVPVYMSFINDYQGVHRSLQAGRAVEAESELGKQFGRLADSMMERKTIVVPEQKKRFVEYFSLLPGKYSLANADKK